MAFNFVCDTLDVHTLAWNFIHKFTMQFDMHFIPVEICNDTFKNGKRTFSLQPHCDASRYNAVSNITQRFYGSLADNFTTYLQKVTS